MILEERFWTSVRESVALDALVVSADRLEELEDARWALRLLRSYEERRGEGAAARSETTSERVVSYTEGYFLEQRQGSSLLYRPISPP